MQRFFSWARRGIKSYIQDIPVYFSMTMILGLLIVFLGMAFVSGYPNPLFTYEMRLSAIDTLINLTTLLGFMVIVSDIMRRMHRASELPVDVGIFQEMSFSNSEYPKKNKSLPKKIRFAPYEETAKLIIRNTDSKRVDNLKLYIYKRNPIGRDVNYVILRFSNQVMVEHYQSAFLVTIPAILTIEPIMLDLSITRHHKADKDMRSFELCIDIVSNDRDADKQEVLYIEVPAWEHKEDNDQPAN